MTRPNTTKAGERTQTEELINIIRDLLRLADAYNAKTYGTSGGRGTAETQWAEQVRAREAIEEWQQYGSSRDGYEHATQNASQLVRILDEHRNILDKLATRKNISVDEKVRAWNLARDIERTAQYLRGSRSICAGIRACSDE